MTLTTPDLHGYDLEAGLVDVRHGASPDWAALYPPAVCHPSRPDEGAYLDCAEGRHGSDCSVCSYERCAEPHPQMTARMAFTLHAHARMFADELADVLSAARQTGRLEQFGDGLLAPTLAGHINDVWAARFVACFDTIAGRLAAGRGLDANCAGEQVATCAILARAEFWEHHHMFADTFAGELASVPSAGGWDTDFIDVSIDAVGACDAQLLLDEGFVGLASLPQETVDRLHDGWLHPHQWFLPFELRD